jgi:hypothetical protein
MIAHAAAIHIGTAPPGYNEGWVTRTVHFHGFTNSSMERGVSVDSPEFEGLGNQWCVRISNGAEGMTSLFLQNMSDKVIDIDFGFGFIDDNGKQVGYKRSYTPVQNFVPMGGDGDHWGFEVATRSKLWSYLMDGTGTLVIEVRMKLANPTVSVPPPFIPENPSACKIIQGLFLNNKSADIVFEVGGEDKLKNNAMKIAKTAPVTFPAHRIIVENCSSIFAELCESHSDGTTPIQINDVTPDAFRHILFYMYGGKISDDNMKSHAKEIIDAADRFGVTSLKLEAEVCLVNATIFGVENLKDILLYADSKNCALLKEAAMDYMAENKDKVRGKISFHDAPGSLLNDFIEAISRGESKGSQGADDDVDSQYNALRISELRKKAYEKGLNVDGSREMLIAALKKANELESKDDSEELEEEPAEE